MAETMEGAPVKQAVVAVAIRPAVAVMVVAVVAVAAVPAEALVVAEVAAAPTAGLEPSTFVFSTELEPGHRPGFF